MSKRFKYLISSILAAFGLFMFVGLPYESRYFGLMAGIVLAVFCFWFGLGIVFTDNFRLRLMTVVLPALFFAGYGLFVVLLPLNLWVRIVVSMLFGIVYYLMFLVENVFMVTTGYKTVPLYRAAYTVNLIFLLLSAFFVFDTLFSFKFFYFINVFVVFIVSLVLFYYQFWSVVIEMSDDGEGVSAWGYAVWPSLVMAQLALALSFWPVGIFKGSVYLTVFIYILAGLVQSDIRERLFKKTSMTYVWITVAVIASIVLTTRWR